jgi:type I restriction enzyme M protein
LEGARQLRSKQTEPESFLWLMLRGRRFLGLKFRRQHPLPPFVVDFYCDELKLAIELDGGQHNEDHAVADDARRARLIADRGVALVRYWNHDLMQNTESVLEDLYVRALSMPRPSPGAARHPLPGGEGDSRSIEDLSISWSAQRSDQEIARD